MNSAPIDLKRPYLVIPKLIEQPTWGGQYIVTSKGWQSRTHLSDVKIGQSYELFSGSNLSLCESSDDSDFVGELTDRDAVQQATDLPNSLPLTKLIAISPEAILGQEKALQAKNRMRLLIKFTQAQGNSFQLHIKDGQKHPHWKPKPESWYYLEPGLITLGVKHGVDWQEYQRAVTAINDKISEISKQIHSGSMTYEAAKAKINELIELYNPTAFVNKVRVKKDELIDLSAGGLHHSWEEDPSLPLGNVLYELQLEAMDDISTIRNYDKGKMAPDGSIRELQIKDYFELIDRSLDANDPSKLMSRPTALVKNDEYIINQLLNTRYYELDKLTFLKPKSSFSETITHFRHLFVKSGGVKVTTRAGELQIKTGHSCFIPAAASEYTVSNLSSAAEVLISH